MTRPVTHRGPRPFTGRHMALSMIAFFGVIIAVNLFMARQASATFGGVVVENSYVASQHFNRWLDEAAAEQALGWKAEVARADGDRLSLAFDGPAGTVITAVARHPLGRAPDQTLRFTSQGEGRYLSDTALPDGRWRLRLQARGANGAVWRSEGDVR